LCPDIDEFLIPNNGMGIMYGPSSLKVFCENINKDFVRANGYTVVHQRELEPQINWSDPLKDRSVCFHSENYCKTIITKVPLFYGRGRHMAFYQTGQYLNEKPDPCLDLVHLKFIDFESDYSRWTTRCKRSPGMQTFTRKEFEQLYDNTLEPKDIYWEGSPMPLKYHWRNEIKPITT
jgi:hypothetical protein